MMLTRPYFFNFCEPWPALSLTGEIGVCDLVRSLPSQLMGSQNPFGDDFAAWGLSGDQILPWPCRHVDRG